MVYCYLCQLNCRPKADKVGEFGFTFPRPQVELEKWCKAIGVKKEDLNLEEGKRIGLCHLHFEHEDILFHQRKHGLKPGAVPCFVPVPPAADTPSSSTATLSPETKRIRLDEKEEEESESKPMKSSSQKISEKSSSGSPQKMGSQGKTSGSHSHQSLSSGSRWSPHTSDDESEMEEGESDFEDDDTSSATHSNYIVNFSKLDQDICRFCPICAQSGSAVGMCSRAWSEKGMTLILAWTCLNGHEGKWDSQPILCTSGTQPVYGGNLTVAVATELCGQTYQPMAEWAEVLGLAFPSRTSFSFYSRKCLLPAVQQAWEEEKENLRQELGSQGEPLSVSADGQFESPGFSSTHGIVSFMELRMGKVLEFSVLKKTEEGVGTSQAIEKSGFERGLCSIVETLGLPVGKVCTDQHLGIQKFLREDPRFKEIVHQLDVWHVSKKLTKELDALGKKRGFELVTIWKRSIRNHVWAACQRSNKDPELLLEIWVSLLYHICDIHTWPDDPSFRHLKGCLHEPLEELEREEKAWFRQDSQEFHDIEAIVKNPLRLKALKKCSHFLHTSKLENFHSLRLKYLPKRLKFSKKSIVMRAQLAAIDYNRNANREPKLDDQNQPIKKRQWNKVTRQFIFKPVLKSMDHSWRRHLLQKTKEFRSGPEFLSQQPLPASPPPLYHPYEQC